MPVIKIVPSKGSVNAIRDYIMQEHKTSKEYSMASGCSIEDPELDFKTMQEACKSSRRPKERTYYHVIVSYNTKAEKIPLKDIQDMTEELCRNSKIDCYQWFGAVHKDMPNHLHCHVIVGNTAIRDDKDRHIKKGKSFRSTQKFRKELMKEANQVCKRYGYEHSLVSGKGKGVRETMAEKAIKAKNKKTWKDELRQQIDVARSKADDLEEFKEIMKESYDIEVMENKKGELRYIPASFEKNNPDCIKPCHERRLGGKYSRTEIENDIQKRREYHERKQNEREMEQRTGLEKGTAPEII